MKKIGLFLAVAIVFAALGINVQAQDPVRYQLTNSAGSVTYSNSAANKPFTLKAIRARTLQPNDSTSVWKRVTREGFTNTIVASQVGASGVFELVLTNTVDFLKGDKFLGTGVGTNSTGIVILEGTVP